MEMLSGQEGAPMRILRAPAPLPSLSAARPPPSLPQQGQPSGSTIASQAQAPLAAAHGHALASAEPRVEPPRMATIAEDPIGDSPPDETGDFPQSSSATRSFEDLTEQSSLNRQDKKRLQRQARVDSKETEC